MKDIKEFYLPDPISWQAPGSRDCKAVEENGAKVKYHKHHLLHNLREVYELFIQKNPSKKTVPDYLNIFQEL